MGTFCSILRIDKLKFRFFEFPHDSVMNNGALVRIFLISFHTTFVPISPANPFSSWCNIRMKKTKVPYLVNGMDMQCVQVITGTISNTEPPQQMTRGATFPPPWLQQCCSYSLPSSPSVSKRQAELLFLFLPP